MELLEATSTFSFVPNTHVRRLCNVASIPSPSGSIDTSRDRPSPALAPVTAVLAGLAAIGTAVHQVATPGPPQATFDTLADWLRELLFVTYLAASVGTVVLARRHRLAPAAAAWLVGLGYGAILGGVLYAAVTRDDPDWFFVLAGPGNLAAILGFVLWAVWGSRHRVLPMWAVLLCGAGGTVAVLLAELGTPVLVGSFFLYLGTRLHASDVVVGA
jgi:hypothetical protein